MFEIKQHKGTQSLSRYTLLLKYGSEEKLCLWRGYVEAGVGFHEGKSSFAETYTEIGRASLNLRRVRAFDAKHTYNE